MKESLPQDEIEAWERRFGILAEGLQMLNAIQRKWVYLEPIFARGALPHERPRFQRVSLSASSCQLASTSGLLKCSAPIAHGGVAWL